MSGPGAVAKRFALGERVLSVEPHGDGHINATYVVTAVAESGPRRRYVLQRINRGVFHDPEAVVRNTSRVIEHLTARLREEGGDPEREVLRLVCTIDGGASLCDAEGEVWRCYEMIERATARSTLAGPEQAYTVAKAFGRFLRWMSDFPSRELEITIPGFHDPVRHLRALQTAVRADPLDRKSEAGDEIAFIEGREDVILDWGNRQLSGEMPLRAVHNDTKINNVLIDEETGCGICVIDLDTVMPGSAVVDIGDCVRSALTRIDDTAWRPEVFAGVVRGYLSEIGALLTGVEIESVVAASRAVALELGTRFLSDFITGDHWFPAASPSENLDRCRGQLDVVRWIEEEEVALQETVRHAAVCCEQILQRGSGPKDLIRFRLDGGRTRR
jgi:hypothetical protein